MLTNKKGQSDIVTQKTITEIKSNLRQTDFILNVKVP